MYDRLLAIDILQQILTAGERVIRRFKGIRNAEDFLKDERSLEKLDAICMQLIAIGESLKKLDKITNRELLSKYPSVEWQKVYPVKLLQQ